MSLAEHTFEHLLRELAPQVLGPLVRRFHDFAAAEDALQEALLAASQQWPVDGLPENPRGWLIQVASRRLTDHVRSETARRKREAQVAYDPAIEAPTLATEEDDTLPLLFMCCHPSLTTASAIALTLRAVGGLTTAEIAHAFLVPEATMAQRISRAKGAIKASGIPFEMPRPEERAEKLRTVLHTVYLIFNEGYTSSTGAQLHRIELSNEAIRLARLVHNAAPDQAETAGLLALMLLTDARRRARTDADGALISLSEQNRDLWDREQIAEGVSLLTGALQKGAAGPYQLQAAIAALHDEAGRTDDTDWPQILAFYELLLRMSDNPMVRVNHAIAAAMVYGAHKGLELLSALDSDARIAGHYRLHATRAHLLEMAGDPETALSEYELAASKTGSLPERDYLLRKAARLNMQPPTTSQTPP